MAGKNEHEKAAYMQRWNEQTGNTNKFRRKLEKLEAVFSSAKGTERDKIFNKINRLRADTAWLHIENGELQEAEELYNAIPDGECVKDIIYGKSRILIEQGRYKKCIKLVNECIKIFPEEQALLLGVLGVVHRKKGEHYEALCRFDRSISLQEDAIEPWILHNKAYTLMDMGYFEEALKLWEVLVDSDPQSGYFLFELARCQYRCGNLTAAVGYLHQAMDSGYHSSDLYLLLCESLLNLDFIFEAAAMAKAGQEYFPDAFDDELLARIEGAISVRSTVSKAGWQNDEGGGFRQKIKKLSIRREKVSNTMGIAPKKKQTLLESLIELEEECPGGMMCGQLPPRKIVRDGHGCR